MRTRGWELTVWQTYNWLWFDSEWAKMCKYANCNFGASFWPLTFKIYKLSMHGQTTHIRHRVTENRSEAEAENLLCRRRLSDCDFTENVWKYANCKIGASFWPLTFKIYKSSMHGQTTHIRRRVTENKWEPEAENLMCGRRLTDCDFTETGWKYANCKFCLFLATYIQNI